mgnify:CR=1 FL=1
MDTHRVQRMASRVFLTAVVVGLCLSIPVIAEPGTPFDAEALRMWEEAREMAQREADFEAVSLYSEAARIEPRIVTCMLPVVFTWQAGLMRLYDMETHPDAYAGGPVPRTLDEIQAALQEDWRDPQALRERGLLYAAVGGLEQAQKDFELALTSDPEPWQVQVLLARVWMVWGEIVDHMNLAAAFAAEPPPDLPERWRDAVLSRPRELIDAAIAGGARGPYVDLTLGEVLLEEYYGDNDKAVAALAATTIDHAAGVLLAVKPANRIELEVQALLNERLSRARFGAGDAEGFIEPRLFDYDTSAVEALCGER